MTGRTSSAAVRVAAAALACVAIAATVRCGGGETEKTRTVVLVTVDTLRRDYVSAYAGDGAKAPASTPRMDALARSGLRFLDARTPVPLTLPAHTTMLSALPPAAHGVRSNSASRIPPRDSRRYALLPEALASAGYCCGAFVSGGSLAERYGLSAGFDAYDDEGLEPGGRLALGKRPGADTVGRALAWIRSLPASRPAFLWVHLFDPHDPHTTDYRADVEAADAAVGALLDGLASAGRGDASVLLTADHGEALGEQGEPSHGFLLGESVLRVPLLLRAQGVKAALRADPADLADVAPTLAHLAGVSFTASTAVPVGGGLDLLAGSAPEGRARVAESMHAWHQYHWAQLSCAVVRGWKYESRGVARDRPALVFRLKDDAPPWQDDGGPAEGKPEATAPYEALLAYRRAEERRVDSGGVAPGGYGASGPVGLFRSDEENGGRPDPYAVISDGERLGAAARLVLANPPTPAGLDRARIALEALARRDADNPAVWFWIGRLERTLARHEAAQAALEKALEFGRWDAPTLLLALRSAMDRGQPADVLRLVARWEEQIPPDALIRDVEAEARGRTGDAEGQKRAAGQALALRSAPARVVSLSGGGCR